MSWPLRVFESRDAWVAAGRPVGGMYPAPWLQEPGRMDDVAPRFRGQLPYFIALPGGSCWSPWCMAYNAEQGHHGDGWTMTGPLEALTVTPSINAVGSYHGFVTAGVISDDCEGRKFTPEGKRVE